MEMSEPIRKIRARKAELRWRRWLGLFVSFVAALNSMNGLRFQPHPSIFRTTLFIVCGLASVVVFLMTTIFWKQYVRWFNRRRYMIASEAGDSELTRTVAG
jgi:hypothetical protein